MSESEPKSPGRGGHSPLGNDPTAATNSTGSARLDGAPFVGRVVVPAPADRDDVAAEPLGRFGYNKVGILATLFLVSGIVGLPLLLLSPAFSRPEKGFWTLAIIIYTAIVFTLFGGFFLWVWGQVGG